MSIVISAFDVGPDTIEPADLPTPEAGGGHILFRAVPGRSAFGYIHLVGYATRREAVDAARVIRRGSIPARSGVYTVADTGARTPDRPARNPITFINCLRFDAAGESAAFARWQSVNDYTVRKPGYLSHVLHRRAQPQAPFGLVNVVTWESYASMQRASDARFAALTSDLPFVALPTWCRPVPSDRTRG